MKCLTPEECSDWLRERGIVEDPYSRDTSADDFCFQFEPPIKPSRLTAFTRGLFDTFGEFAGALVVFTDWALYRPDEMALVDSLRRGHGERRALIDAPGHFFSASEQDETIAHCYLAVMFGWTAYLYLPSGAATVLFWEGDLIDFWCGDEHLIQAVRATVQTYDLRITSDKVV
jgi:hypothetical protein